MIKRTTALTGTLLIAVLTFSAFSFAGDKKATTAKKKPVKFGCTITQSVSEVISYTCPADPSYTFTATVTGTGTATEVSCTDAQKEALAAAKVDMYNKAMVKYQELINSCNTLP